MFSPCGHTKSSAKAHGRFNGSTLDAVYRNPKAVKILCVDAQISDLRLFLIKEITFFLNRYVMSFKADYHTLLLFAGTFRYLFFWCNPPLSS